MHQFTALPYKVLPHPVISELMDLAFEFECEISISKGAKYTKRFGYADLDLA